MPLEATPEGPGRTLSIHFEHEEQTAAKPKQSEGKAVVFISIVVPVTIYDIIVFLKLNKNLLEIKTLIHN